ncbi:MAG: hypothetical protein HOC20_01480 [Chloroflexi bacterium]|jgi:hypothetical protein|nr:hypothetical protein [Chloroflexota bacterium]
MSKRDKKRAGDSGIQIPAYIPIDEADRELYGQIEQADSAIPSMEAAIVSKRGGVVAIAGKLEVSPVGLTITGDLTENEWKSFFEFVQRVKTSLQWIVGDWCAYGEDRLQWTYEDMAVVTGYKAKSLREYAYVARNVKMSMRMDTLTFAHHQIVASLPVPSQKEWLELAKGNKLSTRQLADAIAGSPTLPTKDPLGAKNFTKNARFIGRFVDRVGGVESVQAEDAEKAMERIEAMTLWLEAAKRIIQGKLQD